MIIDKTHSRNDLIELINTLNLKVVFSHVDVKRDIHSKLLEILSDNTKIIIDFPNVYNIKNKSDLRYYLKNKNPKKILTTKEKNDIMQICKSIIRYCNNGYDIDSSTKYNSIKEIYDDMDYIKQYGDIPSTRRCCRLMNKNRKVEDYYIPVLSPQIQKRINDKAASKNEYPKSLKIKRDKIIVNFS
tara:strand:+ start:1027 stop:1584 length:558 start_codon:yes stop_codon:yes gene_type:complete